MKRRILAILLAAIMVLSAVPFSVFAEESSACPGEENIHTKNNCEFTLFKEVPPVCDLGGYSIYTCNECHKQFFDDIKAAEGYPHDPVKATRPATCHETGIIEGVWQCTKCLAYFKDAEATQKYADGDTSYIEKMLDHNWVNQKDNGDCTIDKCSKCGDERVAGDAACVAHEYYVTEFLEPVPTCASKAKANVKCSKCGDVQTNVEVDNNGVPHDFGDVVLKKDATCTEAGYKEHKQCKVCNRYFTADGKTELFANPTTDAQRANALYVDALGHSAKSYLISEKPATCTTPGSRTYRCDREGCGEFIENEVIPANPIKGYWIYNKDTKNYVTVDGTANGAKLIVKKTGTKTYAVWYGDKTLDYPAAQNGTLGSKQEFRAADIILHEFSVSTVNPTCTQYGYTKKVCVLCGTEETVDIKEPTKHLKPNGTVNGTKIVDATELATLKTQGIEPIAPTCTTAGVDLYKCAGCGKVVSVKVNAWGHSTEKTVTTAHCQAAGVTFTYVTAPANAPDNWECTCGVYTAVSSKPFYEEDGVTVRATYAIWDPDTVTTDADGAFVAKALLVKGGLNGITEAAKDESKHVFRTQVVNAATCTTAGNGFKFCLANGCTFEAETYTIPAPGHKFELTWAKGTPAAKKTLTNSEQYKNNFGKTVAATCTTNKYFAVKCKVCEAAWSGAGEKVSGLSTDLANDKLGHNVVTEEFYVICDGKTLNNGLAATKGYKITYCKNEACNTKTAKNNDEQDCGYVISVVETTAYAEKLSYTKDEVLNYHPNLFDVYKDGDTDIPSGKKAGDLKYFVAVYKVGSCTEVGYDAYSCPTCKKNILVVQGNTGAHIKPETKTADNYIAYKAPTCCNTGNEEAYICQRPDCKLENKVVGGKLDGGKLVANTIAATGAHNYVVVIEGKDYDCNADGSLVNGYHTVYTCDASSACCKNKKFFVKVEYVDPADNQTKYRYDELDNVDLSDVYKKGKIENGVVDDVAVNKVAANKDTNIKVHDDVIIEAKHNWDNTPKLPNCTEGGYSNNCKDCGYKTGVVGIKHTPGYTKTVNDTCTTEGYTIDVCGLCDNVYIHTFVDEVVHDWQITRAGVEATCYEYGGDYYKCSICPAEKIENKVAKLAHVNTELDLELGSGMPDHDDLVYYVCGKIEKTKDAKCDNYDKCGFQVTDHVAQTTDVKPTCTTYGYKVTTCADLNCKAIIGTPDVYANPTDHKGTKIKDEERSYDPTEDTAGMTYYKCTACGKTDFAPTEVPATATVYFDYNHVNVTTGTQDYAESNIIKVDVTVNSKLASIGGIAFDFTYNSTQVEFVKFVVPTEGNLFNGIFANYTVVDASKNENAVKVIGSKAEPKDLDVDDGKVVVITLYFRILDGANNVDFGIANEQVSKDAATALTPKQKITATAIDAVKELIDVDQNGVLELKDALVINDLFATGGYDVSADLDKDNEITGKDLQLFYNCYLKVIGDADVFNTFDFAY